MKRKALGLFLAMGLVVTSTFTHPMKAQAAESTQYQQATPFKMEKSQDFKQELIANANGIAAGTVSMKETDTTAQDAYFTFTMPEDGIATLHYSMTVGTGRSSWVSTSWNLYADKNCSVAIAEGDNLSDSGFAELNTFLPKGDYYVLCKAKPYNPCDALNTVGLAVGYRPITGKTTDFTVKKSSTKTTTDNVKLTITASDAEAAIYVQEGATHINLVNNSFTWTEDSRISGNTYTVSKNGKYTIRICDSLGNCDQKIISVDNIDKTKPTSPAATAFKAGTSTITGKCEAGVMVTATIGSKTYSAVTRDNGVFTIKTCKLTKGTKATLQAKDAAGNLSNKKSITVK